MQTVIIIIIVLLTIFLSLYVKYDYTEPTILLNDIRLYLISLYYDALSTTYLVISVEDMYGYEKGDIIRMVNSKPDGSTALYCEILLITPDRKGTRRLYIKPKEKKV